MGPTGHTVENSIPLSIFPIQADKICICFCGKPARGKTEIARKVARYLSFFHAMPVKLFNVGEYRRKKGYFTLRDVVAEEASSQRDKCNEEVRPVVYTMKRILTFPIFYLLFHVKALADAVEYMMGPAPRTAIYDAVNYNHARRAAIYQKV